MVKDYREKAIELEKKARLSSNYSRKDSKKKESYLEEAFKFYESAGDQWILQAKEKENPRDLRNSLGYAHQDYTYAKKLSGIAGEKEKKRIQGKINKLERSLKFIKGLRRRISFATLSITSLLVSSVFVSFNLTGYAIGSRDTSALVSASFFIFGVVFAFLYSKEKRKSI